MSKASKRYGKYRRQIRISGKMMEATFDLKEDANNWYSMMHRKKELIEKGLDIGFEPKLFEAWAGLWLTDKIPVIEPPTFRLYNGFLTNDFNPTLGDRYLHLVTANEIQRLLFKIKQERKLSNATFNRMRQVLNSIFEDACKARPRHCVDNPITQIKKLTENPEPVRIFERVEDMNLYLSQAWERISPPFWIAVMLFLNTGARLGEVLALKRKHIRLEDRFIEISQSMDYKTGAIKPYPKGKRHRLVPISSALFEALQFWFDFDNTAGPEDFVVRWIGARETRGWKNDGRPFSPSHTHKLHDQLCASLELSAITLHGLRHSFATHQLDQNPDLYRLKNILGHQDIKTTERYLHLVKERLQRGDGFSVGLSTVEEKRKLKLVGSGA